MSDDDNEILKMQGWVEVRFAGGTLDNEFRWVRTDPDVGGTYEVVVTGEVYIWDGANFVVQP